MLFVTDLDGTLLNGQHDVTAKTRQALVDFHQRGGLLAACSARPVSSIIQLLQQQEILALFGWCAGFNGGQIYDVAQQHIIHSACLSQYALRDIDKHLSLSRYAHHYFSSQAIYHRYDQAVSPWTKYEAELFALPLEQMAPGNIINRSDIYKITLVADSTDIYTLHKTACELLPAEYLPTITGSNYIDIQPRDVNKGSAIQHLIHHLAIPLDQVAAIGDQQNDVSMFCVAGSSFAMGNAPQTVKLQAQRVVASHEDDGIAQALQWLR